MAEAEMLGLGEVARVFRVAREMAGLMVNRQAVEMQTG